MHNITLARVSTIALGLGLALVSATGCAATVADRATLAGAPHTSPQLELVLEDTGARATFPAPLAAPTVQAVDHRLANQILVEQGGRAEASLRLCVGGDGAVQDVALVRGSGVAGFDDALLASARAWRYQPLVSAAATVCHQARVGYTVR